MMHQKKQLDFDEILKLVDSPMKKGETWYLLYKNWFDYCKKYHQTNEPSDHPGPIDNTNLFQPSFEYTSVETNNSNNNQASQNNSTTSTTCNVLTRSKSSCSSPVVDAISADSRPLRSDLSEAEGHFVVVPEECWNALKDKFGIVSPNHAIKRRVIEIGSGQTIVEIRPISLKICLYGKEGTVEKCFSRKTTFEEFLAEVKKMYNINSEKEIQLWVNSTCYSFKQNVLTTSNLENNNLSPIKPPPTPPPIPKNYQSSPTVVTRQEANLMSKPIALPDSSSIFSDTTNLTLSSESSSSGTMPKNSTLSLQETLDDAGILDSTVVTIEMINKDGNWPSSRPRFGTVSTRSSRAQPGLCGLSNMGNTCFMNAALQCLSNTPPLTNYILTDRFVPDINTNNPLGMHGEIARTYAELIKVMWSGNHSAFLPREFKCAVSRFAPQFNGFAQQDSQELMSFLLDGLHEDLNRIKNKPYIETKNDNESRADEIVAEESWANYKKRNDSIVVDTFHGLLKSTLVCPGCKLVSVTFDPFCYLSLPLPVKREKQISVIFLPAPGPLNESTLKTVFETLNSEDLKTIKNYGASISSFTGIVEENAGYYDPMSRPKSCKMQVPRSGPASEICEIVARIVNDEYSSPNRVKPDNLVVAELSIDHKITKVYESTEHYNQIGDDIVVVEKKSTYAIPLYLRERKNPNSMAGSVIARPMFLHVPDLKFTTLYKSVIASLSNLTTEVHETMDRKSWFNLSSPPSNNDGDSLSSELMDCDDEQYRSATNQVSSDSENCASANGDGHVKMDTAGSDNGVKVNGNCTATTETDNSSSQAGPFVLSIVNSFGSHTIETLGPDSDECNYVSKLYLGATFTVGSSTATVDAPQFAHLRNSKSGDIIESFTPKFSPKPTLQLKDCITQFTTVEKLGVDNEWYCPKCKKHQQATKKFDIWSLPKVLIIHLKRFSFSRSWRDKIDTMVEFPVENLDMSRYVLDPKQKQKTMNYNLIGISNHFGGLGGGHYTAYAKNALQDAWYNFDDALVTPTNASNVVTKSAYVLFYQLQESLGEC